MEKHIAACGIDCVACDVYKATANNDDVLRAELVRQFEEHFKVAITVAEMNCVGCLNEGMHIGHCAVCKIRACVTSRKIANCAYCQDYPCEEVTSFHAKAERAKVNIEAIRAEL